MHNVDLRPTAAADDGRQQTPEATGASALKEQNARAFGAAGYEEEDYFLWQRAKLGVIARILRTLPRKTTLADVGCYTGLAAEVYRQAGAVYVDGFDISAAALNAAAPRCRNVFLWDCDGEVSPAPSGTYDVVVAGDVIEHLINTDRFVDELHRMLVPGGTLILTTPNLASWRSRQRLLRGLVPENSPGVSSMTCHDPFVDLNHIRVNVLSEWRHLLEQHRFSVREVRGSTNTQAWRGGLRAELIKAIDRIALRRPTLAAGLVIVARREDAVQQPAA